MFELLQRLYFTYISPKQRPDDRGFITFAESQSGPYDFTDAYGCALAQYVHSLGHEVRLDRNIPHTYAYILADGSTIDFKKEYPKLHTILITDNYRDWGKLSGKLKGYSTL